MPELTATRLAGDGRSPALLVVGPSLGTSVAALWSDCAALLADRFEVVGWDLPGHGRSAPATTRFSVADLADAVRLMAETESRGRPVSYAGVSLGGAVAFTLALRPGPFSAVVSLASAPRIGEPSGWRERAALVRRAGTSAMVAGSAQRWFAPGFIDRHPDVAGSLLTSLAHSDAASYAAACEALAEFDLTAEVAGVVLPLTVVAGERDVVITPDLAGSMCGDGVRVLSGVGHLPPAEAPGATADLLTDLLAGVVR